MEDFHKVLQGKYPAKAHARKVVKFIQETNPDAATGILYLEGQKSRLIEDNDENAPFRQRRHFYYLSGCALPDSHLSYNSATDHLTLFIPPINPESVVWSGLPLTAEEALSLYEVDDVRTSDEVCTALSASSPDSTLFAIRNQNLTSMNSLGHKTVDLDLLKEAIEECRVIKDDYEIALVMKANEVSTLAHTAVLTMVKHAKNEKELEAVFIERCIANGCREQAYHSIVASGTAAATLHYVKNYEPLEGKLNLLLDAGGEYNCYAADVTRTFPINGEFSDESRAIYDIVLQMQNVCTNAVKKGVVWEDVHLLAHKVAIEGLLALGILKGNKEEIFENRISVAFFPHGLGHYLGLDTHDTGGHANYEDPDPYFRYLRVRGKLPVGAIVTVEPGIYFCRFILEPYLKDTCHSRFINSDVLEKYWDVGGVRIEDNILITDDGSKNLTTAVKDVGEMQKIIGGTR